MFNIDAAPSFWETVIVRLPNAEPETFRALFRVMPVSEFKEIDLGDPDQVACFLETTITGLEDIEDGSGPVTFSPPLLSRLIDRPDIRAALVRAYVEGIGRAAQGN
jgi:hypothetical protein